MTSRSGRVLSSWRTSLAGLVAGALVAGAALSTACSSESRSRFDEQPDEGDAAVAPGFADLDGGDDVDAGHCISDEVKSEPLPLSLIILLDRSGSMTTEKWSSATNAIRAFVDRAEVVGMKVGLQFFPPVTGDECNAATYAALSVPIAVLPDNVLPIQQRLAATSPTGGTPMGTALDGAVKAMQSWLSTNDPHAGAVILVTDGDPSGCGGNIDAVAAVAASAAKPTDDTPPVRTFAVGMQGATFANLDKVAAAGGGGSKAFNVGGGVAAQQALVDALESIRNSISCEYVLPKPSPQQGIVDLKSVEMKFTPGENDPATTIRQVADKDACGATTGGFYYDDPKAPERIILCPATCKAVRDAGELSKVDVVLGCILRPN